MDNETTPLMEDSNANASSPLAELRQTKREYREPAQTKIVDLLDIVQNNMLTKLGIPSDHDWPINWEGVIDWSQPSQIVRRTFEDVYEAVLAERQIVLSQAERKRLFDLVISEIVGVGPLEALLQDETVEEIMVNGPNEVYIRRRGFIEKAPIAFDDDNHVHITIRKIKAVYNQEIDIASPYAERFLSGGRMVAIVPPLSLSGPSIYIAKNSKNQTSSVHLLANALSQPKSSILRALVSLRCSVLIVGEPGSGKSTLLGLLAAFAGKQRRALAIEQSSELILEPTAISLGTEALGPDRDVNRLRLWRQAIRMRPYTVIYEILTPQDAVTVVHSALGTCTWASINGRSAEQGLENVVALAQELLPQVDAPTLRYWLKDAFDYVVQVELHWDYSRTRRMQHRLVVSKIELNERVGSFILQPVCRFNSLDIATDDADEIVLTQEGEKILASAAGQLQLEANRASAEAATLNHDGLRQGSTSMGALLSDEEIWGIAVLDSGEIVVTDHPNGSNLESLKFASRERFQRFLSRITGLESDAIPICGTARSVDDRASRIEIVPTCGQDISHNIYLPKRVVSMPTWDSLMKLIATERRVDIQNRILKGSNVIVVGEPGTGKTMLLSRLCDWFPSEARIVTLESAPELTAEGKQLIGRFFPSSVHAGKALFKEIVVKDVLKVMPSRILVDGDYLISSNDLFECARQVPMIVALTGKTIPLAMEELALRYSETTKLALDIARQAVASVFDLVIHVGKDAQGIPMVLSTFDLKQYLGRSESGTTGFQKFFETSTQRQ